MKPEEEIDLLKSIIEEMENVFDAIPSGVWDLHDVDAAWRRYEDARNDYEGHTLEVAPTQKGEEG